MARQYPPRQPAACLFCGVDLPERRQPRQRYCAPQHAQKAARRALVSTAALHTRTVRLTDDGHTYVEVLRVERPDLFRARAAV